MKYKGSKKRLLKNLLPIFEKYKIENNLNTFVDVFGGGANVISNVNFENKIYNDNDKMLVNLLKHTATNKKDIKELKTPTKEEYDNIKYSKCNNWKCGAIMFFASFNARAYGGCYGATTITKEGKKRDYFQEAKRNILKQDLSNITFLNKEYKDVIIPDNSLVYLDPPYMNTTGYKEKINYNDFWKWVRKISMKNVVLISELSAPNDFKVIWEKEIIHGQNQFNKKIKTEKLFIYKEVL